MGKEHKIIRTIVGLISLIFVCLVLVGNSLVLEISSYVFDPYGIYDRSYPRGSTLDYRDYGFFRINPETILTSLNKGETEVFLPEERNIEDDVWGGPALLKLPTPWVQSDFFLVAEELNQFVWNDTLDNWALYEMWFEGNCEDGPKGFKGGGFTYFRTAFSEGRIRYVTRLLAMEPEYLNVTWGGGALFRHPPLGWKSINLSKIKITAEEAVKIAEENGGREARLKVENKCEISASMLPRNWYGWWVSFGYDFELYIDPYTGEIIK